jgi:hypothetical protein
MPKGKRPKLYDPRFAHWTAEAFHEHSQTFLKRAGNKMDQANARAAQDPGGMIASATSLSLAIELYLKCIRIILGKPIPETHHLWVLYKGLPKTLRDQIEARYASFPDPPEGNAVILEVAVSLGLTDAQKAESDAKHFPGFDDHSLPAVLKRTGHAFITWRYFHEVARPGQVTYLQYEFHYMSQAALVLRDAAAQGLQQRAKAQKAPPAA